MVFFDIMVSVMAAVGLSLAAATLGRSTVSANTFLGSMAISISVLIWCGILENPFIVISILLIAIIVFRGNSNE